MRKQNKIVLWPVYFDSKKTRMEGRRVPRNLSVQSPKLEEIQRAAKRMGLQHEIAHEAIHPSSPWKKTGLLIVPKKDSKVKMLRKIAKELRNVRG
ncbi:MAG: signal recognition particle protein Srp19 [Candidatus Bathyarchaeota archaeon]|nr:signal recognition particle protein Srp19 [Candidatus Bathyarchaeota archaeon]